MFCGGSSDNEKPTAEIISLANSFRNSVEDTHGGSLQTYEVVHYNEQVSAGTTFNILVHVGNNQHYELSIFRSLSGEDNLNECKRTIYQQRLG